MQFSLDFSRTKTYKNGDKRKLACQLQNEFFFEMIE